MSSDGEGSSEGQGLSLASAQRFYQDWVSADSSRSAFEGARARALAVAPALLPVQPPPELLRGGAAAP
jgi:hypothetical protein